MGILCVRLWRRGRIIGIIKWRIESGLTIERWIRVRSVTILCIYISTWIILIFIIHIICIIISILWQRWSVERWCGVSCSIWRTVRETRIPRITVRRPIHVKLIRSIELVSPSWPMPILIVPLRLVVSVPRTSWPASSWIWGSRCSRSSRSRVC